VVLLLYALTRSDLVGTRSPIALDHRSPFTVLHAASTVAEAIKMLEAARVLTWCNRRARVRIGGVVKVIRISNSYRFLDPGSKSELQSGTRNQDSSSLVKPPKSDRSTRRAPSTRPLPWEER
jgi:hypothetical protein